MQLLFSGHALAVKKIQVHALSTNIAILKIDGKRRVIRAGAVSPEGVKLIRSSSREAVVLLNGEELTLLPQMVTTPTGVSPGAGTDGKTVLWVQQDGFFYVDGRVNGQQTRFLIDTGANTVAFNSRTARQLGIDTSDGVIGQAATAGGMTEFVAVTIDSITIGSIVVHNVAAAVIPGEHPRTPLLGASFLNRVKMKRDGPRMELSKNY